MKRLIWIAIMGLSVGMTGDTRATLLTNGGFEADDSATPAGWTQFGLATDKAQTAGWAAYEGTNGFYMQAWNTDQDGGIYQDAGASEAKIYTLDAATVVPTNFTFNGNTLEVSLIFLDGSGDELLRVSNAWDSVNGSTTNVYLPMTTLQACAPRETATARANLHWTTDSLQENAFNPRNPMADSFVLTESAFGLSNGGFEADASATPASWTQFGTAGDKAQTAGWAASEGTNGFWMQAWAINQDGGIYQDLAATPGFNYTLNADIKISNNFMSNGGSLTVALQCLDSSDSLLVEDKHTWSSSALPDTLESFFAIDPLEVNWAPSTTAKMRARIHWTTDGVIENSGNASPMADALALIMEFVPRGTMVVIQ